MTFIDLQFDCPDARRVAVRQETEQKRTSDAPAAVRRDVQLLDEQHDAAMLDAGDAIGKAGADDARPFHRDEQRGADPAQEGLRAGKHIASATNGYNFFNQSTAYFLDVAGNPHVLILGGADVNSGSPHVEVWYQH